MVEVVCFSFPFSVSVSVSVTGGSCTAKKMRREGSGSETRDQGGTKGNEKTATWDRERREGTEWNLVGVTVMS